MANHPNRSKRRARDLSDSPTPAQVREARLAVGLTQVEAARRIFATPRAWENYEVESELAHSRRMHPAMFALFLLVTKQITLAELQSQIRDG